METGVGEHLGQKDKCRGCVAGRTASGPGSEQEDAGGGQRGDGGPIESH